MLGRRECDQNVRVEEMALMCGLQNQITDNLPETTILIPGDGFGEVIRFIRNVYRSAHNVIIA